MTVLRAKVEKDILDLGALAIQNHIFSRGTFWAGCLSDPSFDVAGSFDPRDSLTDTIFDLASTTKALATTPLSLKLAWAQGYSATNTLEAIFSAADFFRIESARPLILAEVLRHEAGLAFWRNFYVYCNDQRRDPREILEFEMRQRHLDHRNVYSDLDMILLGLLLESHYQKPLHGVFHDFLCHDLGLPHDLKLGPAWTHHPENCVTTGFCEVRRRDLQGEVHDENAWALGGFTGHTGLFSSTEALVLYLRAFAASKVGRQVIRENSSWASSHPKSDSALGFRTGRDYSSEVFGKGRGIGHMGFTGTAFWIDPGTDRFALLLTNRVAMTRIGNMHGMRDFRRAVFGGLFEYLSGAAL